MAIIYENKNQEYTTQRSRYQNLRVINDLDDDERYLETFNQKILDKRDDDSYHIVSQDENGRLDIISLRVYGSPRYWWVIAIANELIDPFVVNEGVMLRIPSLIYVSSPESGLLMRGL